MPVHVERGQWPWAPPAAVEALGLRHEPLPRHVQVEEEAQLSADRQRVGAVRVQRAVLEPSELVAAIMGCVNRYVTLFKSILFTRDIYNMYLDRYRFRYILYIVQGLKPVEIEVGRSEILGLRASRAGAADVCGLRIPTGAKLSFSP